MAPDLFIHCGIAAIDSAIRSGGNMSLTHRLTILFLAMLAFVVVGFSSTLFFVAKYHLLRQASQQVAAASNVVSLVAETGPDGVEWEKGVTQSNLDPLLFEGRIAWLVIDQSGVVIEPSEMTTDNSQLNQRLPGIPKSSAPVTFESDHRSWLAIRKCISAANAASETAPLGAKSAPEPDEEKLFSPALSIVVAMEITRVYATLRMLESVLLILSLAIWITTLLLSRIVCQRALLPLRKMAQSAADIDADNLASQRLPPIASKDELATLKTSFNDLLDRLQISFERQRRFVGDASHQLRTPLTAILGQIEVAMRRDRNVTEYRETLATVHQRAMHLNKIVESLLFLAQTDSDAGQPKVESIDLTTWLPDYLSSWSGHERYESIRFESQVAGDCLVDAQPVMLAESLNVLIDNACKYSSLNSLVTVRLCRAGCLPHSARRLGLLDNSKVRPASLSSFEIDDNLLGFVSIFKTISICRTSYGAILSVSFRSTGNDPKPSDLNAQARSKSGFRIVRSWTPLSNQAMIQAMIFFWEFDHPDIKESVISRINFERWAIGVPDKRLDK